MVLFLLGFYEIIPVFWKQLKYFSDYFLTVVLLKQLWFASLNKWTPFPIRRSKVFYEIAWPKKVETFLGKCQWWSSVLIKLQGNVSNTGLRRSPSPWAFPILEQLFCRAHTSISFWPLDAFLVFNREALLCSLSEPATHLSTKEQLHRNFPEKGFIGNVPFWKSCVAAACNFILNKLLPTLALKSRQSVHLDQHSVS